MVTAVTQNSVNIIYGELIKANVKAVAIGPGFEDRIDHLSEVGNKSDSLDFTWNTKG